MLHMNLTNLQLQVQEYSDKTLQPWCLIDTRYDWICVYVDSSYYIVDCPDWVRRVTGLSSGVKKEILANHGNPMNWGRLCYLRSLHTYCGEIRLLDKNFWFMKWEMECNKEYYQQTVLERPVELQELVLEFLLTLPKDGEGM